MDAALERLREADEVRCLLFGIEAGISQMPQNTAFDAKMSTFRRRRHESGIQRCGRKAF
jgi:hypothetical protein